MQKRIERDLLGELEVPAEVYYGIHTQRAIHNFQISNTKIGDFPIFIKALILTKKACALANRDLKTLSETRATMIVEACDHILKDIPKYCAISRQMFFKVERVLLSI